MKERGLFDEINHLAELTKLGDPLEILDKRIDWESFREELETIRGEVNPGNIKNAGRKQFDVVLMFKVLILQRYYNISDDQMEFQLKDRRSFERFKKAGVAKKIFKQFEKQLKSKGVIGKGGKIIDASFIEVPRQRNSKDENDQIKDGKEIEEWKVSE